MARSRNFPMLPMALVAVALVAFLAVQAIPAGVTITNISGPATYTETNMALSAMSTVPDAWRLAAISTSTEEVLDIVIPTDIVGTPPCKADSILRKLTMGECTIETNVRKSADGATTYFDLTIRWGSKIVGTVSTARILASQLDPNLPVEVGNKFIWWTTIHIAEFAQSTGLGKWLWIMSERTSVFLSQKLYPGERMWFLFTDASKVKWGPGLMETITSPMVPMRLNEANWFYERTIMPMFSGK